MHAKLHKMTPLQLVFKMFDFQVIVQNPDKIYMIVDNDQYAYWQVIAKMVQVTFDTIKKMSSFPKEIIVTRRSG